MSESQFFNDESVDLSLFQGDECVELISSGSIFAIYRLSVNGKYFLFKTAADPADSRAARILRREYEISLAVDNPHIAHVVVFGEVVSGRPGILMEYIDGRTLYEFLAENPSLPTRRRIFIELLDAVGYLHKRGIIHNDLKPENILVSRNGDSLKLIDFGLSDDDSHYLIRTPGCTMQFAAPELRSEQRSDIRSDIYSVGRLMSTIFGNRYRRFAKKCTASNPVRRYPDIDRLRRAFFRRNRPLRFLLIIIAVLAFIFAFGIIIDIQRRDDLHRVRELQDKISAQQDQISRQTADFSHLQSSYTLLSDSIGRLNDSYTDLTDNYGNLRDSIRLQQAKAENHRAAVAEAVTSLKRILDNHFQTTVSSLRRCTSLSDAMKVMSEFGTQAYQLYLDFPKTIDDEDISSQLYPFYHTFLNQSQQQFKEILAPLPSE